MANVHVLAFHGELDISQKQWIEQELGQVESFGSNATTILDLSDVRYLDTTFLNALCRIQAQLAGDPPRNSFCVIAARGTPASRLFSITRLDRVFRLFDDMPSARRYAFDFDRLDTGTPSAR